MKTVGFYSYKGGTGKSLAAANFAVFLSRLGYSSIIIDADVLSPSVHHKFADGAVVAPGKGGLLNLISASFDSDVWFQRSLDDIQPSPPSGAHNYVYQLDTPRDPVVEPFDKQFGLIHILPAGDVTRSEYWYTVHSPLWHELFTLFDRYATRAVSDDTYDVFLQYLLKIKAALGRIQLQDGTFSEPDYMIVDFGSGAGEMSTTLINAWVDTLVYMLSFNDENINYLKGTFGKMADAGAARYRLGISETPFDIEVVLSRVPSSIQYRHDRLLERALRALHFDMERMLVLHSDRDLELGEELRCGYQTLPKNCRLTRDYVRLFSVLLEEDHLAGNGSDEVCDKLGLQRHFEQTERAFLHEVQYGSLINQNDNSSNVSFKISTFQSLLHGLTKSMAEAFAGNGADDNATNLGVETLHSAGRVCGEEFGEALAEMMSGRRVGVQEKVQRWTDFDSDVGFGRFWCDEDTIEIKGNRLVACDVYLLESFLTPANDTSLNIPGDHRYCSLMTGYIEGVLSRLFKTNVSVDHRHCPVDDLPAHIQEESGYRDHDQPSVKRTPASECCAFRIVGKQSGAISHEANLERLPADNVTAGSDS